MSGLSRVDYSQVTSSPPLNVQVSTNDPISEIATEAFLRRDTTAPELKVSLTAPIFRLMTKIVEDLVIKTHSQRSNSKSGPTKFETIKKEAEEKGLSIKPINYTEIKPGNVLLVERDLGRYYDVCEASQQKNYSVYTHARLSGGVENPLKMHRVDESVKLHKGLSIGKQVVRQNAESVDEHTRYWVIEDKQNTPRSISIFSRIANTFRQLAGG